MKGVIYIAHLNIAIALVGSDLASSAIRSATASLSGLEKAALAGGVALAGGLDRGAVPSGAAPLLNSAEIKLRAERRAGEILADMPKQAGARGTGSNQHRSVELQDSTPPPKLADIGITKMQSHRWQAVPSVPAVRLR